MAPPDSRLSYPQNATAAVSLSIMLERLTLMKRRSRHLAVALVAAGAVALTACSGGSSDTAGGDSNSGDAQTTLNLYAYAVPKPGFDKVIPAFEATDAGKDVEFQQSYGASGDQSRKVEGRRRGRCRQLLRRTRHHPSRRRRAGRPGLEYGCGQGNSVRFRSDRRGSPRQPEGHRGLGRPVAARPRSGDTEPVQFRVGEVEPARALRGQEQRRREPTGGPGLPEPTRRRAREGAAEVRA